MTRRELLAVAGFALLSGCATMDKTECLTADWYAVGLRDGQAGETVARLTKHRESCSEYGIQPREQLYRDGRAAGLRDYCRTDNAFDTGLKGHRYQGVCPSGMDAAFRRYNYAAYEVHRLRNDLRSTQNTIEGKEYRLGKKSTSDEERATLAKEIHVLERKLQRQRDELQMAEHDLNRLLDEARAGRRP